MSCSLGRTSSDRKTTLEQQWKFCVHRPTGSRKNHTSASNLEWQTFPVPSSAVAPCLCLFFPRGCPSLVLALSSAIPRSHWSFLELTWCLLRPPKPPGLLHSLKRRGRVVPKTLPWSQHCSKHPNSAHGSHLSVKPAHTEPSPAGLCQQHRPGHSQGSQLPFSPSAPTSWNGFSFREGP